MVRWSPVPVAFVLASTAAFAQPRPSKPVPNPAADAALQEGRRLYNIQDWDAAIEKFKEAYKLRPDAASLFNLAQSYRLKGDCTAAAFQYRAYRRNHPNEKNIDKVDKFIVEMDDCAAKQAKPLPPVDKPPPPPVDKPDTQVIAPEPPPPPKVPAGPSPVLRWGGVAAMGIGAVGLGFGVKYALDGRRYKNELTDKCAVSCTSETSLAIERDGFRANRRAWIFTGVGGALAIGGVVMFVLSGRGGGAEAPQISLTPTRGGAAASYEVRF